MEGRKQQGATPKYEKKKYTDADIHGMLDGYIKVHPDLWDRIPSGAHIRYFKQAIGELAGKGPTERFRPGGFVKNHFVKDDKKMIMIETSPFAAANRIQFPIVCSDIDEIWKKYDRGAFIELHLISQSLAQKKKQIDDIHARVDKIESLLAAVVAKITNK